VKTCKGCNQEKELSEYYFTKVDGKEYPRSKCKDCLKAEAKEKQQTIMANPELHAKQLAVSRANKARPEKRAKHTAYSREYAKRKPEMLRRRRWRLYGIDPDLAEAYYLEHNGQCEICGIHDPGKLHMDHCHTTNKIRGMLCANCNHLLGKAKDSQRILIAAIDYLNRNQ